MDIKKIEDRIVSLARKIDNLPFPPKNEAEIKKWEDILDDLNAAFMDWDIADGLA